MGRTKKGQTSQRQLAKELGVSAAYLSQVRLNQRPASPKLQKAIDSYRKNVKQNAINVKQFRGQNGKMSRFVALGEVLELADRHDLGSCAARRGSSTLPFPSEYQLA